MGPDPLLDLPHPFERHIPAPFTFTGHQSIFRISSILLSLRSLGRVSLLGDRDSAFPQ
jgi:hypothetical protein